MDFIETGGAKKFVIVRKSPVIGAKIADRRIKFLMEGTAGVMPLNIVNDAIIAVHESEIITLVAQVRQVGPAVDIGLSQPGVIYAETAIRIAVTKHHHAFAHRRLIRQQCWKAAGGT